MILTIHLVQSESKLYQYHHRKHRKRCPDSYYFGAEQTEISILELGVTPSIIELHLVQCASCASLLNYSQCLYCVPRLSRILTPGGG